MNSKIIDFTIAETSTQRIIDQKIGRIVFHERYMEVKCRMVTMEKEEKDDVDESEYIRAWTYQAMKTDIGGVERVYYCGDDVWRVVMMMKGFPDTHIVVKTEREAANIMKAIMSYKLDGLEGIKGL